jgi:hypothetical protein
MNLRFLAFSRVSAASPINSVCLEPAKETTYKAEAQKVFTQLKNISL